MCFVYTWAIQFNIGKLISIKKLKSPTGMNIILGTVHVYFAHTKLVTPVVTA